MEQQSRMPGIFSMLMDLVKSNEEEGFNNSADYDSVMLSDDSENEDDLNELDLILEENILEEKIKGVNMDNDYFSYDIDDVIGLPKNKDAMYDEQLKVIEHALDQNRKLKKMLQTLELEFLILKRELDSVEPNSSPIITYEQMHSLEFYCSFSAPYFKYQGFPCPVNSDQLKKERAKPMLYEDFDIFACGTTWEEEELKLLEQSIRDVVVQDYFTSLEEKGSGLKDERDSSHKLMVINEVSFIRTADLQHVFIKYDVNKLDWDRISINFENPHSGHECKLMWELYLKPSIRKDKWTRKEEAALLKVAKNLNYQDWDNIAHKIGSNRTGYQCFSHYQQHLCKSVKKWSQEEIMHFESIIRLAKQGESINWCRIKFYIDNSDFVKVYNRWYKNTSISSNKEVKKGKFDRKEDKLILSAIKRGIPLQLIHNLLQSRNRCQIRERYVNYLGVKNRKYGVWTSEEDVLLLNLVKKYGEGQWAKIAHNFKSRSRTQIRQHYDKLKKLMLKNPDIDLEKIKRRRNTYSHDYPLKRLNAERMKTDDDLKVICLRNEFIKDKEDLELIKHFVYKKLVFKEKKITGDSLMNNSVAILDMCQTFNAKLFIKQGTSFKANEHSIHLHDYIFSSIEFVQKLKDAPVPCKYKNLGNSIRLLPPNIVSINSLRNILSRLQVEETGSGGKKPVVESSVLYAKGAAYLKAVEDWSKRMFTLFSTCYILEELDTEFYKNLK